MTSNVGGIDRYVRFVIGAALIVAPLLNVLGTGSNPVVVGIMMILGAVLILTAVFRVCPLYSVLGIHT